MEVENVIQNIQGFTPKYKTIWNGLRIKSRNEIHSKLFSSYIRLDNYDNALKF